jgi:peptidoglycan L-alanyl-D-glutamate endopeptidase CwlK
MSSRSIDDLDARVRPLAQTFLDRCKAAGLDVLITCTLRSLAEQTELYAQGRTAPGHIVTNAKPGSSAHNYGMALDVVPMVHGKPLWTFDVKNPGPIWSKVGELGQSAGLEWFGAPDSPFIEGCHLQMPNWRSLVNVVT